MGTSPTAPELTETHTDVATQPAAGLGDHDRVAATIRDPSAPNDVGAHRSPAAVVIARMAAGTLPLEQRRPLGAEETLVSPPDPLAARQAAHTRAHDAARTLLSGLAGPSMIAPVRPAAAWNAPGPQAQPPGGTLLSPPLGGGGRSGPPRAGYAALVSAAPYPPMPARGPSTAAFVAVAVVGVLCVSAAAFTGMYYGTSKHVTITTVSVEIEAGAPAMPPVMPQSTPSAMPTPPPPPVEPAPIPPPVPPLGKPHEPGACAAYRQMRAKPSTNPATLHALAAACTSQGGTVPTTAPTPTPAPASPRLDPGF